LDEEITAAMVRIEYDSRADAMYIWLRKAKYDVSEEFAEDMIIDLDNLGKELVNKILNTEKLKEVKSMEARNKRKQCIRVLSRRTAHSEPDADA